MSDQVGGFCPVGAAGDVLVRWDERGAQTSRWLASAAASFFGVLVSGRHFERDDALRSVAFWCICILVLAMYME